MQIPVAIKVLNNTTSLSPMCNDELLAEARVMATVQHPYCVRLLGICMTSHMKLITQLLPLGDLRHYVREHKRKLASSTLITWSYQIAEV